MKKLMIAAVGILSGCAESSSRKPDTTVVTETVPPVIDTTVPTILGVAANRTPGAAGWCMLSSHRDVWVGRPVKVVFTAAHKIMDTKVGDTIPGCPGAEPTPGARAYELTFANQAPVEGLPAIVLRNDVWGNIEKDLSATFDLDGDQKFDTITVCTNGSVARFRMVYAGDVPRRPWKHELPYTSLDDPRCADAPAVAEDPNAPQMQMAYAVFPESYQPPYGLMWMALRTNDTGSTLVSTPVLPMVAERACRNGSANGKRLLAAASPEGYTAIFLHVPGLTEGRVERAEIDDFGGTMRADSVHLTMKNRRVTIRREPFGSTGFRMTADVGGTVYTLFETPTSDLGRSNVSWAGDLDRDGEIDFILHAQARNWQTGLQLYLSTQRSALSWPSAATYLERPC